MKQILSAFISVLLWTAFAVGVSSCQFLIGGGSSSNSPGSAGGTPSNLEESRGGGSSGVTGPYGNGEGVQGHALISFQNGRMKCDFQSRASNRFQVDCDATVMLREGVEVIATAIAEGTRLNWLSPNQLTGIPIQSLNCITAGSGLSQSCDVTLAGGQDALMAFRLSVIDTINNLTREEVEPVQLPFGVFSFGIIPHLPDHIARATSPVIGDPLQFGVQADAIPADKPYLGNIGNFCSSGNTVYFSAGLGNIYENENGVTRLFAGSGNPQNGEAFSHRLRLKLGTQVSHLACHPDGIFAMDYDRLLFLTKAGPVVPLFRDTSEAYEKGGRIRSNSSGVAFFIHASNDKLFRVTPTGLTELNVIWPASIRPPNLSQTKGLAVDEDGTIYFHDMSHTPGDPMRRWLWKIDTNTMVASVFADLSNTESPLQSPQDLLVVGPDLLYSEGGTKIYRFSKANSEDKTLLFQPDSSIQTNYCDRNIDANANPTHFPRPAFLGHVPGNKLGWTDYCRIRYLKENNQPATWFRTIQINPEQSNPIVTYNLSDAVFPNVRSLIASPDGSIFFSDIHSFRIHRINPEGSAVQSEALIGESFGLPNGEYEQSRPHILSARDELDGSIYFLVQAPDNRKKMVRRSPNGQQTVIDLPNDLLAIANLVSFTIGMDRTFFLSGRTVYTNQRDIWNLYSWKPGTELLTLASNLAPFQLTSLPRDRVGLFFRNQGQVRIIQQVTPTFSLGSPAQILPPPNSNTWNANAFDISTDSIGNHYVADGFSYFAPEALRMVSANQNEPPLSFASDPSKDCTGRIHKEASASNINSDIQSTLGNLCTAFPGAVSVADSCGEPDGRITLVYSQYFQGGGIANLVKVVRPCPGQSFGSNLPRIESWGSRLANFLSEPFRLPKL